MSSFVGRRSEVREVRRLLSSSRLVTLTGVGGVGKSRLGLQVAAATRRSFSDGVGLVELSGLNDPVLLPYAVGDVLGLQTDSTGDQLDILAGYVRDRQLLLVLDNCEHLLEPCTRLVEVLLRAAPNLRVLVTSRQSLGLSGEYIYPVTPLPVPEPGQLFSAQALLRFPSAALFAVRGEAARPGFTVTADNASTVARLCHRLDGIPLGIELAAVRLRSSTLEQIATRLDDGNDPAPAYAHPRAAAGGTARGRQETLLATVEWSHQLCTAAEQLVWARASVFAGDFDLPAAEAVCAGGDIAADQVLDVVAELIDKSILSCTDSDGQRRYRLLETLRQYAHRKLREAGEEPQVRRRHRDHYLELAERADADWFGPRQVAWVARLGADHPNLRAALEYGLTTPGEGEASLRLAAALWIRWSCGGQMAEGRYWLGRALALNPQPGRWRTRALWIDGAVAVMQGDSDAARAMLTESQAQAGRDGDAVTLAYITQSLGTVGLISDDYPGAAILLEEAIECYDALGEFNCWTLAAKVELGVALAFQGSSDHAERLCEEVRAACLEHGEQWTCALAFYTLALISFARGEYDRALACARECLRIHHAFHRLASMGAMVLELLALLTALGGAAHRAAVLQGGTQAVWETTGRRHFGSKHLTDQHERCRELASAALGAAGYQAAYARGAKLGPDELLAFAVQDEQPGAPPGPARGPRRTPGRPADALTRREREVASLVAQGLTNKQIAVALVIGQRTAEAHVEHIFAKLGLTSRAQLAAWWAAEPGTADR